MKSTAIILAALCVALVSSHPLPEGERLRSEALDRLMVVEADNDVALRSKRTIGILRELFPEISQMIEQKVNSIVAEVIRVLGPTLLQNFLGNNQSGGEGRGSNDGSTVTAASPFDDDDDDDEDAGFKSTSSNGSKVSISLPTYPPDEDEDNETTSPGPQNTIATTDSTQDNSLA